MSSNRIEKTREPARKRLRRARLRALSPARLLRLPFRPFSIFKPYLPRGLYGRSLIIVVAPMVLLQAIVTYVFMERHWYLVTERLSESVVGEIAFLLDEYETLPLDGMGAKLTRYAHEHLQLAVTFVPGETLPTDDPDTNGLLDRSLASEIENQIGKPFWVDTEGIGYVDIRIGYEGGVMRTLVTRSRVYAHNSHIFIVWMVGASIVLLVVAILFLRNQTKPIEQLAEAAERFGMGRDAPNFKPRGASEVRRAAAAFIEMRRRISRQIEQRTEMLAGVSHDLRTPLTRFKLQLAMLGDSQEVEELRADVAEMEQMLEDYLGFARGDHDGESSVPTDLGTVMAQVAGDAERHGGRIEASLPDDWIVPMKPKSFKRCLDNLVDNARKYAPHIWLSAERRGGFVYIHVDDDGEGLPETKREEVFRPFHRLDSARNLDEGGTGLGLAIARDIARGHGGDISLAESPHGGLRATVRLPT